MYRRKSRFMLKLKTEKFLGVIAMKKIILLLFGLILCTSVSALEEEILVEKNNIQCRIDKIGTKLLNSNKIENRVVFVYDDKAKSNLLNSNKHLTKRQVVVYKDCYKSIENDDELAAFLAREIPAASRSYDGLGKGWLTSAKLKIAPKKYEMVFDKLAVDFMVKAGYNPLGLITFINKTCPQARQDKLSNHNLTSKRLANIYERIYIQYPTFIINNTYIENEYYQNFLLTSQNNRKMLKEKVRTSQWNKELQYE